MCQSSWQWQEFVGRCHHESGPKPKVSICPSRSLPALTDAFGSRQIRGSFGRNACAYSTIAAGVVAGAAAGALATQISGQDFNLGDTVTAGVLGGFGGSMGALLGKVGVVGNANAIAGGMAVTVATVQYNATTGAAPDGCGCAK
jgi:hypothetical protein